VICYGHCKSDEIYYNTGLTRREGPRTGELLTLPGNHTPTLKDVIPMRNYASLSEGVWGNENTAPRILLSARNGGEWSASLSGRLFFSGKRRPAPTG
jgi:hypothetical protein